MTAALLDLARQVAVFAGDMLAGRSDAGRVAYKTSATDPVSEADTAAERLITEALFAARPDDGLLGEEGADRRGTSGLRWVIDPLDGTVNFLYGLPAWSVSVACEDDAGAVAGVVYQPVAGLLYAAARHEGAWCGDRRLQVNDPVALPQALLATGFAYDVPNRTRQAATVARVLPRVRDIRRIGSAALDLCAVAAGQVDGYYEDTTSRWDWSAGALIAAEAGARVQPLRDGLVVAGPALFTELVELLGARAVSPRSAGPPPA